MARAVSVSRLETYAACPFKHFVDYGLRPHELSKADVVLVGVSRASKSSTCFYLAYAGVRAANVPLIPGIEPPSRVKTGRLPKPFSIARPAACT